MKTKPPLPIQYANIQPPVSSVRTERAAVSASKFAEQQAAASIASSSISSDDRVIDIFERSSQAVAVPDERSGYDRRKSPAGRNMPNELFSADTANEVSSGGLYFINQEAATDRGAEVRKLPVVFSPFTQKGKIIDTWA